MTADLSFLWLTAGFGVVATVGLLFLRWPAWVGFPLSILAIRFAVDGGIAPLTRYVYGIGQLLVEDVTVIRPPAPGEIGAAVALLLLGYGCIALGMFTARAFAGRKRPMPAHSQQMSLETAQRGHRASIWLFLVGVVINLVSVLIAGTGLDDLGEIAATRAAYTNQAAYASVWFNYAWTLRTTMQIGALAMLLFAYRLRRHIAVAWGANLLYFAIQAVFGGRTTIVVGGLVLAIVYHHGVRKLNMRMLLVMTAVVLSGLVYIATERHKAANLPQALAMSVMQLGSSRAMEEVAFARRDFPDQTPFFYGSTIVSGLSMALPGLDLGDNLWRSVEDRYLGPGYRTALGIGGQTISSTGESFMNFGYPGVVFIALLAGILFGSVYEWQRRNPTNPFALLLAALVTTVFVVAIYKKLPTRISDIPMRMIVPLGFIAAYAAGGKFLRTWSALAAGVILGMAMFRLTLSDVVKYVSLIFIIIVYYYSMYVQVSFGRIEEYRRRRLQKVTGRPPRPPSEKEPNTESVEEVATGFSPGRATKGRVLR